MVKIALRWSGLALVAGALGLGAAIVLVSLRLPERDPTPLESILLLVASILFMLALPTMYSRQSEAAGWLGLVGHVLLEVGNVLLIVYAAAPLFNPASKGLGESVAAFLLALALLLGFVLTAVATLRAAVYPRWSGILLLVAGLGFLFSFFVAEDLPPIAGPLSGAFLGMAIASAFAWIGISIWRGSGQTATKRSSC
jgi:cell division protein FtsW (lipid II flippase)